MGDVLLDERIGGLTVRISSLGRNRAPTYDHIPARAWRWGAALVKAYGVEQALHEIDGRAERVLLRGDVSAACRWRDLICAIHAMTNDERPRRARDH